MANDNTTDVSADLKEVAREAVSGGIRDLAMRRRVQQRARQAREEVVKKFGVQEIGVDIIREMRDAQMKVVSDATVGRRQHGTSITV